MTYTFSKAHGGEIGQSIVELDKLDVALGVEELAKKNGVELVLGSDCTATDGLDFSSMTVKEGAKIITCPANKIPADLQGVDAGPESQISNVGERIMSSMDEAKPSDHSPLVRI